MDPKEITVGKDNERTFSLAVVDKVGYQSNQSSVAMLVDNQSIGPEIYNVAGVEPVDWSSLVIVQGPDDEERNVPMAEEEMYALLGLRDEVERARERDGDIAPASGLSPGFDTAPTSGTGPGGGISSSEQADIVGADIVGAAIPVNNGISKEIIIVYDKERPVMIKGSTFPSMKDFRLVIRQYTINEEFDIGTEKSDVARFMGYCKAEGCPWRVIARRVPHKRTIRVNKIVDGHKCTSTSRIQSSMASQLWVTNKASSILKRKPNTGAKEMQEKLQDDYNVTVRYDTVWKGRQRAMDELYGG